MCGTIIAGDIPNDDQENFRKFVIEIDNNMSDEKIISKIVSHLDDLEKLKNMKSAGLSWSTKYTQEKYAERFIEKINNYARNSQKYI